MDTCKGVSALKMEELEMSTENVNERTRQVQRALLKRWKSRVKDNSSPQNNLDFLLKKKLQQTPS
jgi:hypothetical protein